MRRSKDTAEMLQMTRNRPFAACRPAPGRAGPVLAGTGRIHGHRLILGRFGRQDFPILTIILKVVAWACSSVTHDLYI